MKTKKVILILSVGLLCGLNMWAMFNSQQYYYEYPEDRDEALRMAAQRSDIETIQRLIDQGVDVNAAGWYGKTALMNVSHNHTSHRSQVDIVKLLLNRGAKVNAVDEGGNTALMRAADIGNIETVKLLLDRGANINAVNEDGETALMWASKQKHSAIVKLLIERGANANAINQ